MPARWQGFASFQTVEQRRDSPGREWNLTLRTRWRKCRARMESRPTYAMEKISGENGISPYIRDGENIGRARMESHPTYAMEKISGENGISPYVRDGENIGREWNLTLRTRWRKCRARMESRPTYWKGAEVNVTRDQVFFIDNKFPICISPYSGSTEMTAPRVLTFMIHLLPIVNWLNSALSVTV